MPSTIIGILPSREAAEDAIMELESHQYNPKDFTILMRDEDTKTADIGGKAAGGAVSGAATGAVVGILAGLLVSAGVLPGLGALFIGGPLASSLGLVGGAAVATSGAATGALAGGIIGLLGQLGLNAQDAKTYEKRVREGAVVVAVPALSGEEDKVTDILKNNSAEQIRRIESQSEFMIA